jgi:hypothetical protein
MQRRLLPSVAQAVMERVVETRIQAVAQAQAVEVAAMCTCFATQSQVAIIHSYQRQAVQGATVLTDLELE